jgi:predicted RND superfamily exporter protein
LDDVSQPTRGRPRLFRTPSQWIALALCAVLGLALFAFVDLTPEVEADFFFSTDDPQLQGTRVVERQFGSAPQIFIAARSQQLFSAGHLQRIRNLTRELDRIRGVIDVRVRVRSGRVSCSRQTGRRAL